MLQVQIIAVGKLKESWLRAGCAEYVKRLSSSWKLQIYEVADRALPERPSVKEIAQALQSEGAEILKAIPQGNYTSALTLSGTSYSSVEFANHLQELSQRGLSRLSFIIGSSYGLGINLLSSVNEELSFGSFTFPHQLCRLMLLEQLYRAYTISANLTYHK